ncbi:MAG TPA: class I SAM-dependent methyltransferase [Tepidiformaceae bacterium]|nr:class I SAM-dependent methyltransferase [Tepidiformaceae bacterium]
MPEGSEAAAATDEIAEQLTGRRPDRYAEVLDAMAPHRRSHGCALVSPTAAQARELAVVVRATRATYVLELGAGLGYAALHMVSAFGYTGRLDAVEGDPVHATLMEEHVRRYALEERIRVQRAAANEVVSALSGPYDLLVIHPGSGDVTLIYEDLLRLLRTNGSLVALAGSDAPASRTEGLPSFAERLADDDRILPSFGPGERVFATRIR